MFMPSIEGGGVEKNFFIVSNYLVKFNRISVITISNKFKNKFNKKIKFISLNSKFWDNLNRRTKYFLALILLIKEILYDKNNIVFCFQANIYTTIVCKLLNIKVIIRSNSAPIGWSKNYFKKKIFSKVLNFADKVVVNSHEFKKDLKKEFKVNSECIYNPLNKKEILKKSKKRVNLIFKDNVLKIINVGRFVEQKDQLTLLKALNKIKYKIKFNAVLMGQGVLKYKLNKYIKENKLQNHVKLFEFKENPFPYIKQSDLFVLSSSYEGLPNVLLETLVLERPIISSNCRTGPKEILLNGKGGQLFEVGNYKQLARLLIKFNENKKKYIKKLKFAKKNLDRFDFNRNLKRYLYLVKSLT